MQFAVVLLRHRGRILSPGEISNQEQLKGDLRIEEMHDPELRRYVRMVRLLVLDRPVHTEVIGVLFEPQLIAMSPIAFTLSGWERVEERCYGQSWLVRLQ